MASTTRSSLDDLATLLDSKMTTHIADELSAWEPCHLHRTKPLLGKTSYHHKSSPKPVSSSSPPSCGSNPLFIHRSPIYACPFPSSSPSTLSTSLTLESDNTDASDCIQQPQPKKRRCLRKSQHPQRSAIRWDPSFRGVTMQMRTIVRNDSPQLAISAVYNCDKIKKPKTFKREVKIPRLVASNPCRPHLWTGSHTRDASSNHHSSSGKQCASCGTKKTPLWRDAEDGTPLCNACGIRYKKYRMRCTNCWHIPKKDTKIHSHCGHCGHLLKLTVFKHKMW